MAAHLIATVNGGTLAQYDQASADLIKSGMPAGLLHHVCVPTDDGFMVIETWESEKAIEDFTGSERFSEPDRCHRDAGSRDRGPTRSPCSSDDVGISRRFATRDSLTWDSVS